MNRIKKISPWQFTTFRIVFGLYLTVHFAQLLPYANELFGSAGVLADAGVNPLYGLFPNPLVYITAPGFPFWFVALLLVSSLAFTAGAFRRSLSILLWFGWACLFNRNNLIANPGIPYVGLLLVLCALVPPGEPFSIRKRIVATTWCMPAMICWCAWTLLAVGYCYSGVWKLFSPSWIDGSALMHLITNPLARPEPLGDFLSQCPSLLKILTWTSLAGEILFLPLCVTRRGRMVAWLWMLLMHLGIVLVVNFADLTFGMLMVHLFTFDPKWFPARGVNAVVLFDGDCAMCNRWVRFITEEEQRPQFRFASLQASAARSLLRTHGFSANYRDSIVVIEGRGAHVQVFTKLSAVLRILKGLGGFWSIVAWLRIVPRSVRDWFYDQVAKNRHRLFRTSATCAILSIPPGRFLDGVSDDSHASELSERGSIVLNTSLNEILNVSVPENRR